MKHPTELNTLKFNTIFFPRCADNLFKVAIMFLKFNPFPLSSQEYLFFGDKDSVFNSFNLLSFTETYNDTHKYLSKACFIIGKNQYGTLPEVHKKHRIYSYFVDSILPSYKINSFFLCHTGKILIPFLQY